MNVRIVTTFLMLIFFNNAFSLELQTGIIFKGRDTISNAEHDVAYPVISNVIKQIQRKRGLAIGDTNLGSGSNWYRLYRNMSVYGVNVQSNALLGNWPLTPKSFPCEAPTHCLASPWHSVRWNSGEALEKSVIDRYQNFNYSLQPYYDQKTPTLGCLGDSPLKYGDIEGDGVNELVLYIGGNWMIFSTELNKVTFMTMMDVGDWMSEAQTIKYFAYYREPENALLPKETQYQSLTSLSARGGSYLSTPGYRGYSKLYFGDFDNDAATAADILVWRKLYQSRLAEDPLKGFEKLSDMYAHFRWVDGEYQRQTTEQSQIQAWISSNNETWSSGYPSTSECVGQEGQLIPEMHDPLLNDPDVLVPVPVVTP